MQDSVNFQPSARLNDRIPTQDGSTNSFRKTTFIADLSVFTDDMHKHLISFADNKYQGERKHFSTRKVVKKSPNLENGNFVLVVRASIRQEKMSLQ
nr:AlNc14C217G9025 [Albugo laibachii Nc14]|eukprot:CCA23991.1 AlNc14C217G9025 [Albugo laibachii Nc14]